MNEMQAVIEIIREARKERGTVIGYKRVVKALKALEFNSEDAGTILVHLDYHHPDTRAPYSWLAAKLK